MVMVPTVLLVPLPIFVISIPIGFVVSIFVVPCLFKHPLTFCMIAFFVTEFIETFVIVTIFIIAVRFVHELNRKRGERSERNINSRAVMHKLGALYCSGSFKEVMRSLDKVFRK